MPPKHRHVEAFYLMLYREDATGKPEWIWNSRDGVTPFGLRSATGKHATHAGMRYGVYAPDHAPRAGDRIFVDLTLERALAFRREFVQRHADVMVPAFKDMTLEQRAVYLAEHDVAVVGTPDVVVVTAEMAAAYATHGVDRHPDRVRS